MAPRPRTRALTPRQLTERARRIKLLLLDVDGVLTDGRLFYDSDGRETKAFHAHDGHGLVRLRDAGIRIGLLSGRASRAVQLRANELKIDLVFQGVEQKVAVYEQLLTAQRLKDEQVAYAGDDLPDLGLLERVGLAIAVASAQPEVRAAAHWVTLKSGGAGAVREIAELLLEARA